jgi:hypothetical protein
MRQAGVGEFADLIDSADNSHTEPIMVEDHLLTLRQIVESRYRILSPKNSRTTDDIIADIRNLASEYQAAKTAPVKAASDPASVRVLIYSANPEARIVSLDSSIAVIICQSQPGIPLLPRGYAYKGGAARLALERTLNLSRNHKSPRDLDLLRFGFASSARDRAVAQKFMPEDVRRGHSVEVQPNLPKYLSSRDLTINEVAFTGDRLYCSFAAVSDTLNGILRPTKHVCDENGCPQGRISTKILRLIAEAALEGRQLTTTDLPRNPRVTTFDVALHLNRVLERGTRAAEHYLAECVAGGYLKSDSTALTVAQARDMLTRQSPSVTRLVSQPKKHKTPLLHRSARIKL